MSQNHHWDEPMQMRFLYLDVIRCMDMHIMIHLSTICRMR